MSKLLLKKANYGPVWVRAKYGPSFMSQDTGETLFFPETVEGILLVAMLLKYVSI